MPEITEEILTQRLSYDAIHAWAIQHDKDEVAGIRWYSDQCPLANYLTEQDPEHAYNVYDDKVTVDNYEAYDITQLAHRFVCSTDNNTARKAFGKVSFREVLETLEKNNLPDNDDLYVKPSEDEEDEDDE